jgi:3alpha(or 20beta)-hydroxysteroid dehydrogenase
MPGTRLDGKVAIITGAAMGQGATEAAAFVAEGARVLIADVADQEGSALADELGDAARYARLDVRRADQWSAAVQVAEDAFGPVSVLVNNAGILRSARLPDVDPTEFRQVLEVNLVGPFLGIQAVVPSMERAGGGSIVNISSTGGLVGMPGLAAYTSSKHGLTGLTKTAAIDLGPRSIRVNSVHPGGILTPMSTFGELEEAAFDPYVAALPIKRMGRPEDVAPLVVFLASDESAYCTAGEYLVDGGSLAGDLRS